MICHRHAITASSLECAWASRLGRCGLCSLTLITSLGKALASFGVCHVTPWPGSPGLNRFHGHQALGIRHLSLDDGVRNRRRTPWPHLGRKTPTPPTGSA